MEEKSYQCLIMAEEYDDANEAFTDLLCVGVPNCTVSPGYTQLTGDVIYEQSTTVESTPEESYALVTFAGELWQLDPEFKTCGDFLYFVPAPDIDLGENDIWRTLNNFYYEPREWMPPGPCKISGHVTNREKDFWIFTNPVDSPEFLGECSECLTWLFTGRSSPRFKENPRDLYLFLKKLDVILTQLANEDPQTMKSFMNELLDKLAHKAACEECKFVRDVRDGIGNPRIRTEDFFKATVEVKKTLEELSSYKTELRSLREEYLQSISNSKDLMSLSAKVLERNIELTKRLDEKRHTE